MRLTDRKLKLATITALRVDVKLSNGWLGSMSRHLRIRCLYYLDIDWRVGHGLHIGLYLEIAFLDTDCERIIID